MKTRDISCLERRMLKMKLYQEIIDILLQQNIRVKTYEN